MAISRFIKIYKKEVEINTNCMDKVTISQVVGVNNLSADQYSDLLDYFEDITMVSNYTAIDRVSTFELVNRNEILQDCPLPNGTVINDKEFEETTYIIAIGILPNYGDATIKIGVRI